MSKVLRTRVPDSVFETLLKLAKVEGKSLSSYTAGMLADALKRDMQEVRVLQNLLSQLETIATSRSDTEFLKAELQKTRYLLFELFSLFAEFFFIDRAKREAFLQKLESLRERLL